MPTGARLKGDTLKLEVYVKLPGIILEQGTECIKQLTEKNIDKNCNMSDAQKKAEKEWYTLFLDIWKERVKDELKKANLLLE